MSGLPGCFITPAENRPAGFCTGMCTVLEYLHAVHEYVGNAGGQLMRLFIGGIGIDRCRIEDDDVCVIACPELASALEIQAGGGQAAQFMDRFFEGNDFFIADISPQEFGKVAISPGVGAAL